MGSRRSRALLAGLVPTQPTVQDQDIERVRALVRAGVIGQYQDEHPNPRWPELCAAAAALGITPANAIYRVRDGIWSERHHHDYAATAADFIREANTR